MKIALSSDSLTNVASELVAVGVREGKVEKSDQVKLLDKAMGGALLRHVKDEDFRGKSGEVLKIPSRGRVKAAWIVLVGLGSGDPAPRDARLVGVRAAAVARNQKSIALAPPAEDEASIRAAAEGLVTGVYRYTQYLTGPRKPKGGAKQGTIVVSDKKAAASLKGAADAGVAVAEAVTLARDLVNAPPNDMNPPALAEAAKAASAEHGVKCTVWDKKRIEKEGMHLLLAVNRGSGIEPRFVHMAYTPANASKKVVFVGKGLTFDSGGLCIKPAKSMIDMKCDMAGAAVTIGVVIAAARLKLPVEVHGVIGSTENMSGDHAYRPGDVFPSLDGKTVEIINTDAEGRLVLADVLAWARKLEPDYMIDHATLTGACMVALGPWTAGFFANDDELARGYLDASQATGESLWRLPLDEDLREGLKSDIADLKHTGEPHGGAISAAMFLREFIGDTKWAHLDIAGPAFLDRPHGTSPKGGTGFGIATAIRFLEGLAARNE